MFPKLIPLGQYAYTLRCQEQWAEYKAVIDLIDHEAALIRLEHPHLFWRTRSKEYCEFIQRIHTARKERENATSI
jgi:hypothetical protein